MRSAASEQRRRQPPAAALGQNGRLGKPLRVSRRDRLVAHLAAGNGLQIAAIMPHLHRSQIRWSSVVSVVRSAKPSPVHSSKLTIRHRLLGLLFYQDGMFHDAAGSCNGEALS